jgi:hypothetical protein
MEISDTQIQMLADRLLSEFFASIEEDTSQGDMEYEKVIQDN